MTKTKLIAELRKLREVARSRARLKPASLFCEVGSHMSKKEHRSLVAACERIVKRKARPEWKMVDYTTLTIKELEKRK